MILCCGEALIDMLPAESAGPGGHSYHQDRCIINLILL